MKTINDAIKAEIRNMPPENGRKPIPDGITNTDLYTQAPQKILFILKEAYDEKDGNKGMGGWDHDNLLSNLTYTDLKRKSTYRRVSKLTSCILRKSSFSEFLNAKYSEEEIMKDFRSIAWINVGKYPAPKGTTTKDSRLKQAYNFWKPILLKQISSYKPDIIIFGRTFPFFKEDLIDMFEIQEVISSWIYKDKFNRLYIATSHPSNRISDQEYIDSIVNAINEATPKS